MRQAKNLNRRRRCWLASGWRKGYSLIVFCGWMVVMLCSSSASAFVNEDRISTSKGLAHYTMGYMYDLLGEVEKATLEYEKAVHFDSGNYLIHLRLGADYARLELLDESIKELRLVHKYNEEDLQSHYLLALIYSTQKEYEKAAEEYEIILQSFSEAEPQNIEIYGYLGQLYYSQKKYKQAIEQFEKILIVEPLNADIMYLLGSLYLEVDDKNKAIEVLKRAISFDPLHDGSLNTLGYLYADMGQNLGEAAKLIERSLEVSPDNGAYLDSLGWVYYKQKKYNKALEVLFKADVQLKDPVIYDHMGDTYYKLNDTENAIKYWKLSLELLSGQDAIIEKIDNIENAQASR